MNPYDLHVESQTHRGDSLLLLHGVVLSIVGLGLVYSASSARGMAHYANEAYFFKRQLLWTAMGIAVFFMAARISLGRLRHHVFMLSVLGVILLGLVLLFGPSINGAQRWLRVGSLQLQPSEGIKLLTVLYLAHYVTKRDVSRDAGLKVLLFPLAFVGLEILFLMAEPDMGTSVVLFFVLLLMLFLAGASLSHLLLLGGVFAGLVVAAVLAAPYRINRLLSFLDPWAYAEGSGYQLIQSLIALGEGGPFGVGAGEGMQKMLFLPESHTDFIFAILGEEFGLLGTLGVLALFASLGMRGWRIARTQTEPFLQMLGIGITLLMMLQTLIHIGVTTAMLPTKGLSLPFVSYGGSSLVVNWMALGLLWNISRQA